MSTRAVLIFGVQYSDGYKEYVQVYRHWDGYPNSVVQSLMDFYNWYFNENEHRSGGDVEYESANYIFYMKLKDYQAWKERGEMKWKGWEKLGYGIQNYGVISGDIEYIYKIIWDYTKSEEKRYPDIYMARNYSGNDVDVNVLEFKYLGSLNEAIKGIENK